MNVSREKFATAFKLIERSAGKWIGIGGCSLPGVLRFSKSYSTSTIETNKIPEPRGVPFFGTLFSLMMSGGAKKLHEYVDRRHRELGPIYRESIGPVEAVFVKSPHEFQRIFRFEGPMPKHLIPEAWALYNQMRNCRRGLLFMEGNEWLHFRRILNKVMLLPDPLVEPCLNAANELANNWKERVERNDGSCIVLTELEAELYQWSIDAMLATLMGSSWERNKLELSRDSDRLARMLHKIFEHSSRLSMIPAKLAMNLRLSSWLEFVLCVDTALDIVKSLVPKMAKIGGDGLLKKMMDEGIRNDDAVRIVTDFILAAGDTTATSMQWVLLLLSKHPECQEKLYQKVNRLSSKDVLRDPFLKGIIKEALRLHPVAPFLTRYLPEDTEIGNYLLPKGQLVLLSIYSSGRDAASFPRPNEFLPERWIRTEKGNCRGVLHPHASLPFAFGARSCIGRKLAETQMLLSLAELVKTFKIECINANSVKMILHLISVPSESIQLKLTLRANSRFP